MTQVFSPLLTVAPAVVALVLAVVMGQLAPTLLAATKSVLHIVKPFPVVTTTAGPRYAIKRAMRIAAPVAFGDWRWNEEGAPLSGAVLITVDIASETLSVFRAGHQIGTTRIIYGDDDKPTPVGIFPITQKSERHRSNLFVDAPMPYMLRMTNDGISVHGATSINPNYATNGCIGIPNGFAARLFAIAAVGHPIVVTRSRILRDGDMVTLT